jgi:glycosyltransferase involved in cell wall biosynthesis
VQLPIEPTPAANRYRSVDLTGTGARATAPDAAELDPDVDCVYMLMFPGWEHELRSNRWHFASRWARQRPVVLVQPTEKGRATRSTVEKRIPNCRVLHVAAAAYAPGYFAESERQSTQIAADMRSHGYSRPLLWLYNPQLAATYGALPAVCRVFHATENYFQFPWSTEFFLAQTRAALRISDLVVTVSAGVAASVLREVPAAPHATVTNGCDHAFYATNAPNAALAAERARFERIAIYAGNINWRLEFGLMARCAAALPRTLFAFYGPVIGLTGRDARAWRALRRLPNVRHYGAVDPDALPGLYAAADLGVVPYKDHPWIVDSGFPLKVLEMCAAGLPVVTTMMKPIEKLAGAVKVCGEAGAFEGAVAERSRGALSAAEREEMRHVCVTNDYDLKFGQILPLVTEIAERAKSVSMRVDQVRDSLPVVNGARARLHEWLRKVPVDFRGKIPPGARRVLRNLLDR